MTVEEALLRLKEHREELLESIKKRQIQAVSGAKSGNPEG